MMHTQSEHHKVLLLGAFSLILGVSGVFLFFEQGMGVNYPLFMLLAAFLVLLLVKIFKKHLLQEQYVLLASGLFFALMVFVRSSELLTFFNIVGSGLLFLMTIVVFTGKGIRSFVGWDYLKVFFLPFRFIGPFFETLPVIVSMRKAADGNTKGKEIIRGSLMAAAAVLVFAWLFSSADAGFAKLLSNIFDFDINPETIGRIFMGTFITAFFIGAFGFIFRKTHPAQTETSPAQSRMLGSLETTILLGAVNALFLAFIILQITYLFGGASHLIAQGLTYAEYAREGFSQLVFVGIFAFLIISFAERQIIQRAGAHLRSFQFLSGALVLQVIAVLVSAFSRLSLYEHAYGFTTIRLYSHAFMIWLGVALVLLFLHIWRNGKQQDFIFRAFCTVVLLLFVMNVLSPDVFIAKKNLERYVSTGLIDTMYLGSLSDDALPYTIRLLDDPKEEVKKGFAREVYSKEHQCDLNGCEGKHYSSWQSDRLSRSKARELLVPYKAMLEENKSWSQAEITNP